MTSFDLRPVRDHLLPVIAITHEYLVSSGDSFDGSRSRYPRLMRLLTKLENCIISITNCITRMYQVRRPKRHLYIVMYKDVKHFCIKRVHN